MRPALAVNLGSREKILRVHQARVQEGVKRFEGRALCQSCSAQPTKPPSRGRAICSRIAPRAHAEIAAGDRPLPPGLGQQRDPEVDEAKRSL